MATFPLLSALNIWPGVLTDGKKRGGSRLPFLPLLLARAQRSLARGLHGRAGGPRLGRPVGSPRPAGLSGRRAPRTPGCCRGHGSSSRRGAEQNPGRRSRADERAAGLLCLVQRPARFEAEVLLCTGNCTQESATAKADCRTLP